MIRRRDARGEEAAARLCGFEALIVQAVGVAKDRDQLFGLLAYTVPEVFVLLDVLEVLQSLDVVEVLAAGLGDAIAAVAQEILEQNERFVHVAPVLPVIVESLPYHIHDLNERDRVVRGFGDLEHLRRRGPPRIVRCGFSNFDFSWRIVLHHILDCPPNSSHARLF